MGSSQPPYKLLDSDASDSSSSSSSSSPPSSFSSPIVFCIHGNKWGLATCCEDIDYQNSAEHEPMVGSNIYHSSKRQTKTSDKEANSQRAKNTQNFDNVIFNSSLQKLQLGYQTLEEGGVSKEESTLHCHQSRREGVDERYLVITYFDMHGSI